MQLESVAWDKAQATSHSTSGRCETLQVVTQEKPANIPASSQNLANTIGRNTVFGIVASVAQMGTRLVTVPIVIGYLGLDGYGIWSVILTTAAYMRRGS